jgi:cell division protein ZapA
MNTVKIRICGNDYLIKGNESEEYVQKIGLFVDKKMSSIMRESPSLSISFAAVLTAVNTADDYFKERDQSNRQKASLDDSESKNKELQSRIKIMNSKIEKLTQTNEELKAALSDTAEQLQKAKNEFR